jgi:hypothetical protein
VGFSDEVNNAKESINTTTMETNGHILKDTK